INECTSQPCENDGNCTNTDGSYRCDCSYGWEGVNCTNDIDECTTNPCENDGNCTNINGSYSCDCSYGWTGVNCTI
ncbi:hypothetical protein ACJMK2_023850, partial [Sinanodonta woodiana]